MPATLDYYDAEMKISSIKKLNLYEPNLGSPVMFFLCVFVFLQLVCLTVQARSTNEEENSTVIGESVTQLHFKDFFRLPVGPAGLEFDPEVLNTAGKKVRITGYMVQRESSNYPGEFFLTARPVQMSQHADGDADDLPPATLLVKLAINQANWLVPHTSGLIELTGILSVGRQESTDGRVSWLQLQLDPQALQSKNLSELTGNQ